MKTTTRTPSGNLNIQLAEGEAYRLTGHTIPTHTVDNDPALIAEIGHDDGNGDPSIELIAQDDALVVLGQDKRHGNRGWRGSRYEMVNPTNERREWDECYLFFPTLREAIELFGKTGEALEAGMTEARRQF